MLKGFTEKEKAFLMKLNTPLDLQQFIDTLKYNSGERISIIDVLRLKLADCLEAACLASYIFKLHGHDSFIMDLSCKGIDDDHVICVFKQNGLYGAVAQSKYLGLKGRNPVYKNLRELAMSYFDNYFNFDGEFDLETRSVPLRIKTSWINSPKDTIKIERMLHKAKHIALVPHGISLPKVCREKFKREIMLIPKGAKVNKIYQ
jgi:hypothetical protein